MSKIATKPKTLGIKDSYEEYSKQVLIDNPTFTKERAYKLSNGKIYREDGSLYVSYKEYRNILALYYIKAGIKLIHGYTLDLLCNLGNIFIMRQGRNPSIKPRMNKGESFKRKRTMEAKGEEITKDNWKVFYTDEEFTRTNWFKHSYIKHITFYKFLPAGGQTGKGFRNIMSRTINSNPSLLAVYPFVPYKIRPNGI